MLSRETSDEDHINSGRLVLDRLFEIFSRNPDGVVKQKLYIHIWSFKEIYGLHVHV